VINIPEGPLRDIAAGLIGLFNYSQILGKGIINLTLDIMNAILGLAGITVDIHWIAGLVDLLALVFSLYFILSMSRKYVKYLLIFIVAIIGLSIVIGIVFPK